MSDRPIVTFYIWVIGSNVDDSAAASPFTEGVPRRRISGGDTTTEEPPLPSAAAHLHHLLKECDLSQQDGDDDICPIGDGEGDMQ